MIRTIVDEVHTRQETYDSKQMQRKFKAGETVQGVWEGNVEVGVIRENEDELWVVFFEGYPWESWVKVCECEDKVTRI